MWCTASGRGGTVTTTSAFRTLRPSQTFTTEILQGYKQTYGVGQPIILYFSQRITDKAAVERALRLGDQLAIEAFETRVLVGRHPDDPDKLKSAPMPKEIIAKFMNG